MRTFDTGPVFKMLTVQLVILFVTLVTCAEVKTTNCCTPPKWEAKLNVISGGESAGSTYFVQEFQNVSMDTTTYKVARVMTLIDNGVTSDLTVIQDFFARTQYRISNGVCKTSSIEAWTPKCIPDEARPILKSYFGAGSTTLDLDAYMFLDTNNTYVMTVSPSDCTPITLAVTTTVGNKAVGYTIGTYSNMTLGIQDPSVFDIPDICKHQPIVTSSQDHILRPDMFR